MSKRRKRGRPPLKAGEKGTYKRVLKPEEEIRDLAKYNEVPLIVPDNRSKVLERIFKFEESAINYWNLVWSTAFTALAEKRRQDSTKKFTLSKAANEAKVPYYNVKTIHDGQGEVKYTYQFMLYYYINGIDIQEIRLRPEILIEALLFYFNLKKNGKDE
jgi:hypothetical protein